jgi:hypothetical protein
MTDPAETDRDDADRPRILDSLTHQRSARTDPSMRDGDSGYGNPYESGDDPESTDADVGDAAGAEFDTADSELVRDGVPIEPATESASADEVGRLVQADDRSDQNHAAEAGPTTDEVAALGEGERPGDLPIEGYEGLTIPQIVAKLDALARDEVLAVREYEAAHRKRKTLLDKLDRHLAGGRRRSRRVASGPSDED